MDISHVSLLNQNLMQVGGLIVWIGFPRAKLSFHIWKSSPRGLFHILVYANYFLGSFCSILRNVSRVLYMEYKYTMFSRNYLIHCSTYSLAINKHILKKYISCMKKGILSISFSQFRILL